MVRHPDYISAAFLIAVGALFYYMSFDLQASRAISTFSARFFPQLASICIMLCGLGVLFQAWRAEPKAMPFLFNRSNLLVAAIFLIFFMTFEKVDFRVGAWAVILSCMFVLGCRSWLQLALTPLITSLFVYWIFTQGFEVVLPAWT
ncbi:MAG: tripartite tricarboxylate transporter TctB family protein [Hyphomicrobiales bacterium]|nr:tripartite tricarboxylate transporter TctB family protein [Hyphomicrobiales bacterium]